MCRPLLCSTPERQIPREIREIQHPPARPDRHPFAVPATTRLPLTLGKTDLAMSGQRGREVRRATIANFESTCWAGKLVPGLQSDCADCARSRLSAVADH